MAKPVWCLLTETRRSMGFLAAWLLCVVAVTNVSAQSLRVSEIGRSNQVDWVELINVGDDAQRLADYRVVLRDHQRLPRFADFDDPLHVYGDPFVFPEDRVIVCMAPFPEVAPKDPRAEFGVDCVLFLRAWLDPDGGEIDLVYAGNCRERDVSDRIRYLPLLGDSGLAFGIRDSRTFGRSSRGDPCFFEDPTPGEPNAECRSEVSDLLINEVSPGENSLAEDMREGECSYDSCADWVEIVSVSGEVLPLSDYALFSGVDGFQFPEGAEIAPGERVVVLCSRDPIVVVPDGVFHAPFGIAQNGDALVLASMDGTEFDRQILPALDAGQAYARIPDGGEFRITSDRTPAAGNRFSPGGSAPKVDVEDRFPLRVVPGDRVSIVARIFDVNNDLDEASLWLESTSPQGEGSRTELLPGDRIGPEPIDDDNIYVAGLPVGDPGSYSFRVLASDFARNTAIVEFEVWVQEEDWKDDDPTNPTHFLKINEVAAGNDDDWVEIYNTSPDTVITLDGMYITDNVFRRDSRLLPTGIDIPPQRYFRILFNGNAVPDPIEPEFPFQLNRDRDEIVLYHRDSRTVVDFLEWHEGKRGRSLGRYPDGGSTLKLMQPTPLETNELGVRTCLEFRTEPGNPIVINEILADNWHVAADAGDEYGDYLELYNRGEDAVSLAGWELVDLGGARDEQFRARSWRLPPLVLAPGQRRLIWCDNDECENPPCGDDPDCWAAAEIHSSFEINRMREYIAVVNPAGVIVDCASIAFQARDVAVGRFPDGSDVIQFLDPSPGDENAPSSVEARSVTCAESDQYDGFDATHCEQPRFRESFLRGDANLDCDVTLADAVYVLSHLFLGGRAPRCRYLADSDDSGSLSLADAIIVLQWRFLGGVPPSSPGPLVFGPDPTQDPVDRGCVVGPEDCGP
ncbi:MAG: lamin tail domain-containing protein [Planctomycetota bacterium]